MGSDWPSKLLLTIFGSSAAALARVNFVQQPFDRQGASSGTFEWRLALELNALSRAARCRRATTAVAEKNEEEAEAK